MTDTPRGPDGRFRPRHPVPVPVHELPTLTLRMAREERNALRILAAQRQESVQSICLRAIRQYVSELATEEVECSG